MHSIRFVLLLAALTALTLGCGQDDEPQERAGTVEEGSADDSLKALGAADAKLARAQATCPVSGEELGSMGTPIKVTAGGRTVFLCCEGCRKRFEKDPAKYLAKLK